MLDCGIPPAAIRVAGDSSGEFLATALLGDLARSGLPVARRGAVAVPECLTAENEALAESIRVAGGDCELQLWPGQIHGFPIVGGDKIPEARAARDYAARFLSAAGG